MAVSEQIIQVLDALCEKFGLVIDWTNNNVISYLTMLCGKLIAYEIWTSVIWIVLMVALTIAGIMGTKMLYPIFKKGVEREKDTCNVSWQLASAGAITGLIVFYSATITVTVCQLMDIIKCVTFPEMFVFEYVYSIINAAS